MVYVCLRILYVYTHIYETHFLKRKMAHFSVASLEKLVVWETPLPPLFHAPDGSEIENDFMAEGGEGSAM